MPKLPTSRLPESEILESEDSHEFSLSDKILILTGTVASIVLVSAGAAMHSLHRGSLAEFILTTLAIIPLSTFISYSTKKIVLKLQKRKHEFLSGLVNAVLGNFTELAFVIVAVTKNEPMVAQTALAGSLLSHTLLILGTCFLCGGLQNHRQSYPLIMARVASQLLLISLSSLIVPTAFKIWSDSGESGLVDISRGGAIVLLIIFCCYLAFFYYTHNELLAPKDTIDHSIRSLIAPSIYVAASVIKIDTKEQLLKLREASLNRRGDNLHWIVHLFILILSAPLLILSSIFMLEAIDSPSEEIGFSKSFVGLVVVPIIIGAAEHVATAIRSHKNRRDEIEWIIEVAIISSIRTSLFVLPVAVLLGWILDVPGITLFFDGFQVTMLTLAILLVNYIVHTGIAHWLEGIMLIGAYILFANAAWRYPNEA